MQNEKKEILDTINNVKEGLTKDVNTTNNLITENQANTTAKFKEMEDMFQTISARMDRLETESDVTILNTSTTVNNSTSRPLENNTHQTTSITNLSNNLQEYITLSSEPLTSVAKAQWLVDQALSNKLDLAKHNNLAIINTMIPHRDTLISAVVAFNKHSTTIEGRKAWNSEFSKNAKTTSRAAEKFHEFRSGLSMLITDQTLNTEIRTAT